ncbi:MAG: hypothetical protein JET69_02865 [Methanomassiliicoccales archaeon]|nr:hypothetical protein [Methanomassiliicoccales archaeon]
MLPVSSGRTLLIASRDGPSSSTVATDEDVAIIQIKGGGVGGSASKGMGIIHNL